ncbi:hypothetical protein PM8797T_05930 [Gimesia maris DSM 8797]|nr:hypothetical protein PM8797T_05930 [Gimesia maris DSM 8797]
MFGVQEVLRSILFLDLEMKP